MDSTGKNVDKKILFLTGTRADFGKLKALISRVDSAAGFTYHIFATGMHTISRYGLTIEEIRKSGFIEVFPYINQMASPELGMDIVLAQTIQGLGHYIREIKPDLIVIHGDRVEALAGAIVGALNNILVAHIEGGELSGTVDELIRHAVSKLSHLHFVANDEARKRLIQMGELESSIYVIGSPDIDIMLTNELPSLREVKDYYEVDFDEYSIFMYHPVTTELHLLESNIKHVIDALIKCGRNFVVIYPNNDSGSNVIFNAFKRFRNISRFRIIPSLRFEYFLTLLKNSKVIVGNSSAGVREAPVYGVPTVNIGKRQMNRFNYPSIINVRENKEAIIQALNNLPQNVPKSFYFGKGNSANLFIAFLQAPHLWETLHQKQFHDLVPMSGH